MNNTKKKILAVALVISLLAIMSFSTLAWFNASASVTNQFHVSSSDDGKVFDIIVEEKDVPDDGTDGWVEDDWVSEDGLTYEGIAPGDELDKNVRITNIGAYDQYVRVRVTVSDYGVWQKIYNKVNPNRTVSFNAFMISVVLDVNRAPLMKKDGTALLKYDTVVDSESDSITFMFYLDGVLEPGYDNSVMMMDKVHIPTQFDQTDILDGEGKPFGGDGFKVVIVADAVQVQNLPKENAYDAFHWLEESAS